MTDGNGRVAIVTGGRRGIGRAIATALAADGFDLAICDISERGLLEACDELAAGGRRVFPVRADVSNAEEVRRMVAAVEAELGRIDALVNNAGIGGSGSVQEIAVEDWDRVMAINARGP